MGAEYFKVVVEALSAREAFVKAVKKSKHHHGQGGYTGSIVGKTSFFIPKLPNDVSAVSVIQLLEGHTDCILLKHDKEYSDLFEKLLEQYEGGDALCFRTGPIEWTFIGTSSS